MNGKKEPGKRSSGRSKSTLQTQKSENLKPEVHQNIPPCDTLTVKVLSLRTPDEDPKHFAIKVTYFDQLILNSIIKSIGGQDEEHLQAIATGTMDYDPSDHEKMSLFADNPLIVNIQPLRNIEEQADNSQQSLNSPPKQHILTRHLEDISCCNIDILSIFLGEEEIQQMCVKKRMEPMITPRASCRKSWDNLPMLSMELLVERNPQNAEHHKLLKEANWMKVTVIASYNMYIPFEDGYTYTVASKTPLENVNKVGVVKYDNGYREPKRFNGASFYPKWETLRVEPDAFTRGDQKLQCRIDDIQNDDEIDLPYYMNRILPYHTAVWGSFHRTLMFKSNEKWLYKHLKDYKWPLELHIYGEDGGFSFMGCMNLFRLLYPGEKQVNIAVPLNWINKEAMSQECGCELLLSPIERAPSAYNERTLSPATIATFRPSKITTESAPTSVSTLTSQVKATGADDNCSFVIVEIRLGRPLKEAIIPPDIPSYEISEMLSEIEQSLPHKRECVGRGQLEKAWQDTVRAAATSLRKVAHYGSTEFCSFNRQLSETRTRVELMTSCWQDAATFINNAFVVQDYQRSEELFEELVMMAHACLMRSAYDTLIESDDLNAMEPELRAARHARQMQDTHHAMELYMQLLINHPREANYWRELSTCLKDLDREWAAACLNKSVVLNPRHPLTLVSKGAMLFEEEPGTSDPFFLALLAFNPTWVTLWVIAGAYFYERQLFLLADTIMKIANTKLDVYYVAYAHGLYQKEWEEELGDWWDFTPLLQGMSLYYEAADLLLRLRAVPLAEVCVARGLAESGESATYYHLVGLCCRLRGDYDEALCHLKTGIEKFGEVSYLRSLEAECLHRIAKIPESMASYDKAGNCVTPFSILMSLPCRDEHNKRGVVVDLVRRQPSAYAWTVLSYDFLKIVNMTNQTTCLSDGQGGSKTCARACAIQALKFDRRAGRAWLVLAKLVKPSVRRVHCLNMANVCGFKVTAEDIEMASMPSKHSTCHFVGQALRECRCELCENMQM
ncbi:unnamed protein product [Chrysodeixis includens]|uniref:Uncharacterized protein n=1 Tax=Chrysodeixis includens TaxID=689277 RepID=A0A9P0FPM2_CHRIL|nr:unnamed protein product [Chrysodeixis includens]